jgi:thioredoxin reductase
VVVVVGAGAAGFVAGGALVLAELEHPVNASATTARLATAVPALTMDLFTATPSRRDAPELMPVGSVRVCAVFFSFL